MAEAAKDTSGVPRQALEAADMAEDLHAKMFGKKTPEEPEQPAPTPSGEEPGKKPEEAPNEGDTPPAPQAKEGALGAQASGSATATRGTTATRDTTATRL